MVDKLFIDTIEMPLLQWRKSLSEYRIARAGQLSEVEQRRLKNLFLRYHNLEAAMLSYSLPEEESDLG